MLSLVQGIFKATHSSELSPQTPEIILSEVPYFPQAKGQPCSTMSPCMGQSLFIIPSLGPCSKAYSCIHHAIFQGRNQKSISFQGLSDGHRNQKKIFFFKLGLDRSKVDNSSWEAICFTYLSPVRAGRKREPNQIKASEASTTYPYLENIYEEYKENMTRNSVCYQ